MNNIIDNQHIICGDAITRLNNIPDNSINLIVTDPPYNLNKKHIGGFNDAFEFNDYIKFSKEWLKQCKRILTKNGTIYVFMGMKFISYLYTILEFELNLHFNSWITWVYSQGVGKTRGFSPRHDDILMFTKNKSNFVFNLDDIRVPQKCYRKINNMRGSNPGNVWNFSHVHYCNKNRQKHPTQKPEALYERMILASSNPGDVVLDPFAGSGTCSVVCKYTNRKGISIDVNPTYCKMIKNRLQSSFNGFDSIDNRLTECPNDLNDPSIRREYINNHIKWFLKDNTNAINLFLTDVKNKYYNKMIKDNQLDIFQKYNIKI